MRIPVSAFLEKLFWIRQANLICIASRAFACYRIVYGTHRNMTFMDNNQWVLPFGLQILFAGLLAPLAFLGKESPRWLVATNKNAEALSSLEWIHSGSTDKPQDVMTKVEVSMASTTGKIGS